MTKVNVGKEFEASVMARLEAVEKENFHLLTRVNELSDRFGMSPLQKETKRQNKHKNSAGKKRIENKKSTSKNTGKKGKYVCSGCKKQFKTKDGALWHIGRESKLDGIGNGPCAVSKASIKEA